MQKDSITSDKGDALTATAILLWLLLIGVRWVATPLIMFGDPGLQARVAIWDRGPLLIAYLLLASILIIKAALRFTSNQSQKSN